MITAIGPSVTAPGEVKRLYHEFGQRKAMGASAPGPEAPHFFLHRKFLGESDLLVILNTKRCRYQCHFCQLPAKSSRVLIPSEAIVGQFMHVMHELRHSLSVLDRVTLSNEGSTLDCDTLPPDALLTIADCIAQMRSVRRVVLETRLEFVDPEYLARIRAQLPGVRIDILTGFETVDETIRDTVLVKREPLDLFLRGLDHVAAAGADLTGYVLFKPSDRMSDRDAWREASRSIDFLVDACAARWIRLTVRLNPMYAAAGSKWASRALGSPEYAPPRLSDVIALAEEKRALGVNIYVGASTEGIDDPRGNYRGREDFSPALLKHVKIFNASGCGVPERV